MRKFALLLAAATLWGCDGPSGNPAAPVAPTPDAAESRADAIHAAAAAALPVDGSAGVMIGILDRGQTPTSNLVLFRTPSQTATYRYERTAAGWVRAERVADETPAADEPGIALATATGYSGQIARIQNGSNTVDQWFVSNIKAPGSYYQTEGYGVIVVDRATFFPGSTVSADTQFTVSMGEWRAYRDAAPECSLSQWTSTSASWTPLACHRTDNNLLDSSIKPQRFWLRFNLAAAALPPLEFTITDFEANDSEYRGFSTSPTTFSSTIQNVVWEASPNSFSWTTIPNSSCGKQYTGAFRGGGPATFFRATVTLADGRVAQRSTSYARYVDITDVYNMC